MTYEADDTPIIRLERPCEYCEGYGTVLTPAGQAVARIAWRAIEANEQHRRYQDRGGEA